MNLVVWSDRLSVGVPEIDDQHQELVQILNDVSEVLSSTPTEVEPLLVRLVDYTNEHFRDEEALMRESGYPLLAGHEREHIELAAQVLEIRQRMVRNTSPTLVYELLGLLRMWLTNHIQGADRHFGRYYADWQAEASSAKLG